MSGARRSPDRSLPSPACPHGPSPSPLSTRLSELVSCVTVLDSSPPLQLPLFHPTSASLTGHFSFRSTDVPNTVHLHGLPSSPRNTTNVQATPFRDPTPPLPPRSTFLGPLEPLPRSCDPVSTVGGVIGLAVTPFQCSLQQVIGEMHISRVSAEMRWWQVAEICQKFWEQIPFTVL